MLVRGDRAGAGRCRNQSRPRRASRTGGAAVGQTALGDGGGPELQRWGELLRRPVRQLLRRQCLPYLQHQLHRARDHGTDQGKQVVKSTASTRGAALLRGGPLNREPFVFFWNTSPARFGG